MPMDQPAAVHLITFSPTGTTRTIVREVAAGFAPAGTVEHDLTRRGLDTPLHLDGGIAVFGAPVHAGRVPLLFLERIGRLSGTGAAAILIALYGNRAVEDALAEMRDAVAAKGFRVFAAAAFIGEHSFSTPAVPIAAGRPDAEDLRRAREFGAAAGRSWRAGTMPAGMAIPGTVPYKERVPPAGACPETRADRCSRCAACAEACPASAVAVGTDVVTEARDCIMCCACVRACPSQARAMVHPLVEARRGLLAKGFGARQEPACFF